MTIPYIAETAPSSYKGTNIFQIMEMLGDVQRASVTPTYRYLREEAGMPVAEFNDCKIYRNGYAVYIRDRKAFVMWIGKCAVYCRKTQDSTGDLIPDWNIYTKEQMESFNWYDAVALRGDFQYDRCSFDHEDDRNKKRLPEKKRSASKSEDEEDDDIMVEEIDDDSRPGWAGGTHFDTPEAAYIKKETILEAKYRMTDKQWQVFLMKHYYGYSTREIGEMLGVAQRTVIDRLEYARKKLH